MKDILISKQKESILCFLFCIGVLFSCFGQGEQLFVRVTSDMLKGRSSAMAVEDSFGRLPTRLKSEVRGPVWFLGENSAGVYVEFNTNSNNIIIRYQVASDLNMPHMPTTGVSGVDLYLKANHNWSWAYGSYQFKDTIQYTFSNIGDNSSGIYRLYLPLYNSVKWLDIGVGSEFKLSFPRSPESKPIVVYGTSIAQGACVSRPGMAWTSIVGRSFENKVINFGFSGNGRLEQPILDLMIEEDAAAFILDCLPNLMINPDRTEVQLDSLIRNAVKTIRCRYSDTPIILAGHSSAFTPGFLNRGVLSEYGNSTEVGRSTYEQLKREGIDNLYWLASNDMGLDINSTVDYAHPNDFGMDKIAQAYIRLLTKILK